MKNIDLTLVSDSIRVSVANSLWNSLYKSIHEPVLTFTWNLYVEQTSELVLHLVWGPISDTIQEELDS